LKKSRLLVKTIRRKPETPLQVPKRSQLFIRTHNETLFVTAMRVNNQIVWLRSRHWSTNGSA
jgi:hypothetical protein